MNSLQQIEQSHEHTGGKAAKSSGPIYYGWVIVAVCFVVLALISLVAASFPIFYVPALQDFNRSRGSIALAMSFHMILSGVAAPLAGWLIDRFGPQTRHATRRTGHGRGASVAESEHGIMAILSYLRRDRCDR